MSESLAAIAKSIQSGRERLRKRALELKCAKGNELVVTSLRADFPLSVGAVDSGLINYSIHGAEIVSIRCVGVIFDYEKNLLKSSRILGHSSHDPTIEIGNALDEHDGRVFVSLIRLKFEISKAIELVQLHKPELLLMDGSLAPLPSDRPSSGSPISNLYAEVISLYHKLYSICDESGTKLCGVIKDSRSRRISKTFEFECSDSVLFEYVLDCAQRTVFWKYFEDKDKDFVDFKDRLFFFYLKASKESIPLRIEYLCPKNKNPEEFGTIISSSIYSLSSISEAFAYPAVLVEADLRAAMDQRDATYLETTLVSFGIKTLRRNDRPFR